jgi:hypothetical protein
MNSSARQDGTPVPILDQLPYIQALAYRGDVHTESLALSLRQRKGPERVPK